MSDFSLLEGALDRVLTRQVDFADVYMEDTTRSSLRLDDERVEVVNSGVERGIGIRAVAGDTTVYVHTGDISEEAVSRLCAEVTAALASPSPGTVSIPVLSPQVAGRTAKHPANRVAPEDKVKMMRAADESARATGDEVTQVTTSYLDSQKKSMLLNSLGQRISESRDYTRFMVQVVAARGETIQTGYDAPGKQGGAELFDEFPPDKIGRAAAGRALLMLDASHAPTGPMSVVLGPGSGGVIFHEAVGHGLEGDHIHKGSVYSNLLGSRVASEAVTLLDDSTLDGLWGSYAFDDEGEPSRRRVLIEDGVLKGYLCDRYWGRKLGVGSSGSGRREGYSSMPIARMSNTFLQPGELSHEEIVAATDSGIYAKKLGGGQVDPQTGDFMFSVSEGYQIEGGKIVGPVRGATLIGNGPDILSKVDLVGNDLDFDPGTCGKDGQGVPVCIGQPTCRVTEMTVGGTGGGDQ